MSVILVTACDARFFEMANNLVRSVREKPEGRAVTLAVLDVGLTAAQRQALLGQVDLLRQPESTFAFPPSAQIPSYFMALLARPFLRTYFPGFDVYLWIDADAWVQDWSAIDLFLKGAQRRGLAIVAEADRGPELLRKGQIPYFDQAAGWYETAYGADVARRMRGYPMLNAGVFALSREAPHWEPWAQALGEGVRTTCSNLSDQLALNLVIYQRGLFDRTELLPAWCNWMCHNGMPGWDRVRQLLVEYYLPHAPIGILHQTGSKQAEATLSTTDGAKARVRLGYPATEEKWTGGVVEKVAASQAQLIQVVDRYDYVSPGLQRVVADSFFPNMVAADPYTCAWPFLRRWVPHRWYVDRRAPEVGFVSLDEAHLLFNTALSFRGQRALQIGCWLGWSTCHLALGGVSLDVIDPVLARPEFNASIDGSLTAAGVRGAVQLVAGSSPDAVVQLAREEKNRWSLFFIDGDHTAPAPLRDAIVCEQFATDDALILFHDLSSPDVAEGLNYLKNRGWQTLIYHTMQLMGAAWRGKVRPVAHEPDPRVSWLLPDHLRGDPVSLPLQGA